MLITQLKYWDVFTGLCVNICETIVSNTMDLVFSLLRLTQYSFTYKLLVLISWKNAAMCCLYLFSFLLQEPGLPHVELVHKKHLLSKMRILLNCFIFLAKTRLETDSEKRGTPKTARCGNKLEGNRGEKKGL